MDLSNIDPATAASILAKIARLLAPYPRAKWPLLVAVLRGPEERSYVCTSGEWSAWLRSNALESSARECARRVRPGEVRCWVELDSIEHQISHAGFWIIDWDRAIRAVLRSA